MAKKDIVTDSSVSKPLYDELLKFHAKSGYNVSEIIPFLLDYAVGFFDWTGQPVDGWRFKDEDNHRFASMLTTMLNCIVAGYEEFGWYDIFGDLYMKYVANKDQLGQCFTPNGIAETLSRIMLHGLTPEIVEQSWMRCGSFGVRPTTNDPTCGSGRLLLASCKYIHDTFNEYAYAIGEDVDLNCCKQTAINLAVHGYYGEVVCHNTISEPDSVRVGFIVNEGLHPSRQGLPTIRRSNNPDDFVITRYWRQKREETEAQAPKPLYNPENTEKSESKYIQLSFFDL